MSKRSYIVARNKEELDSFSKSVLEGLPGGFVIMPSDMYQDLIPTEEDKAHFCTVYNGYKMVMFKPMENRCEWNKSMFPDGGCKSDNIMRMRCEEKCL